MREQASWLNVTFSSGELSLEAHMKTGDPDSRLFGGQEVRLLNVPGDTESGYAYLRTCTVWSARLNLPIR